MADSLSGIDGGKGKTAVFALLTVATGWEDNRCYRPGEDACCLGMAEKGNGLVEYVACLDVGENNGIGIAIKG